MLVEPFLAGLSIMLASLAGVFFVWTSSGRWLEKNLRYLTSFALGVFGVTIILLVGESWEMNPDLFQLILAILLGASFLHIAIRLIPKAHHHHGREISACQSGGHSQIDARRMLLGDAVHNIGDGILLVPAFLVDVRIGLATATAIFLHELVQEIAEFFVLREAGFSTLGALVRNFLVSATILIGLGVGFYVSDYEHLIAPLLAFSAGGFWYVIVRDLLPDIIRHTVSDKKEASKHLSTVIVGVILMFLVSVLTGHSHVFEDDDHGHEESEHVAVLIF
ncbi:MAG: ZIP family metal transporter [Candidatus Paceibacterota bacterium]